MILTSRPNQPRAQPLIFYVIAKSHKLKKNASVATLSKQIIFNIMYQYVALN